MIAPKRKHPDNIVPLKTEHSPSEDSAATPDAFTLGEYQVGLGILGGMLAFGIPLGLYLAPPLPEWLWIGHGTLCHARPGEPCGIALLPGIILWMLIIFVPALLVLAWIYVPSMIRIRIEKIRGHFSRVAAKFAFGALECGVLAFAIVCALILPASAPFFNASDAQRSLRTGETSRLVSTSVSASLPASARAFARPAWLSTLEEARKRNTARRVTLSRKRRR